MDTREYDRLVNHLETFSKRSVPFAMRDGINRSAFAARKIWQQKIRETFVLRGNKFTAKGAIQVEKARGIKVNRMEAVLGSIADYQRDQEDGVTLRTRGKHGKAIPTSAAAGQKGARPRTRLVSRRNKLTAITLTSSKFRQFKSKRQRIAVAVRMAKAKGQNFIFLKVSSTNAGIYRLIGKRPKMRRIWDMSHSSVRIKPQPTLEPTVKRMQRVAPPIFLGAVKQQVKRAGLFRG